MRQREDTNLRRIYLEINSRLKLGMAIKPVKFGPYFWGVLHLACAGGIDPQALQALVALFPAVLPCPACGVHFAEVLNARPLPETTDPEVLFKWSVDVHNIVNERLEKPLITYEQARDLWLRMPQEAPPPEKSKFDIKIVLIIILLIALALALFARK